MSFSQTCNLVSQFVKENRAFGLPTYLDSPRRTAPDAAGEGYNESTMNLFPVKPVEDCNGSSIGRTINLFPQLSGFNSSEKNRGGVEHLAAPMTIFYDGQVMVFDDFPDDLADNIINLASTFESSLKRRKVANPASPVPGSAPVANANQNPIPSHNPTQIQCQNFGMDAHEFRNHLIPVDGVPRVPASTTDLPIARKASLHRFLEKRKDRLMDEVLPFANTSGGHATKPSGGSAWLGLSSIPVYQP